MSSLQESAQHQKNSFELRFIHKQTKNKQKIRRNKQKKSKTDKIQQKKLLKFTQYSSAKQSK